MATIDFGTVRPGTTLYIPFDTYAGTTGASITITGLAVTDIEIYKDGGTTQRASDNGYTLLDTDGIDFDGITGIQGFSVSLADNSTAGFYAAGSRYFIVVSAITIDAQTVNFIAATFDIGYPDAALNTTIATLASQTSFTLTVGPAEDDALNGRWVLIHDVASAVQTTWAQILDYTGSTKTVTLAATPATTFTVAATDNISIMGPVPLQPTVIGRFLDVSTGGEAGLDWANVGSPTTSLNLSATNIDVDQTVASVSGAVGSVTGAVGSVTGAVGSVASGGITAASLAADAITAAKIADGAIDAATFAAGAINAAAIASDAITAVKIAADAITAAKLAADVTTELQAGLATPTNITAGIITTVSGNVSGNVVGSVGSVVGAVGSVTGNVGGNVTGTVGSVVGAVGSVTGNVGGNVNGNLVGSLGSLTVSALAQFFTSDSGETYADAIAGSVVKEIVDNAGGIPPTVQEVVDGVYNELRSAHTTAGTFGQGVASVQGNITGTVASVVGAVGSVTGNVGGNVTGTVGSVVGAVGSVTGAVGSVATDGITSGSLAASAITEIQAGLALAATALSTATWTSARAGYLDNLNALKIKKNSALAKFPFLMVLSSNHISPATGLTVTVQRSIDGAAFGNATNTPAIEVGDGVYVIDLSAADLNGDTIVLKMTSATADQRTIVITTEP